MNPLVITLILSAIGVGGYVVVKKRKANITVPENIPDMKPPDGDQYNASADMILGDVLAGSNPTSQVERIKGVITTPGVAGALPVARPTLTGTFNGTSSNKPNKPLPSAPIEPPKIAQVQPKVSNG